MLIVKVFIIILYLVKSGVYVCVCVSIFVGRMVGCPVPEVCPSGFNPRMPQKRNPDITNHLS